MIISKYHNIMIVTKYHCKLECERYINNHLIISKKIMICQNLIYQQSFDNIKRSKSQNLTVNLIFWYSAIPHLSVNVLPVIKVFDPIVGQNQMSDKEKFSLYLAKNFNEDERQSVYIEKQINNILLTDSIVKFCRIRNWSKSSGGGGGWGGPEHFVMWWLENTWPTPSNWSKTGWPTPKWRLKITWPTPL